MMCFISEYVATKLARFRTETKKFCLLFQVRCPAGGQAEGGEGAGGSACEVVQPPPAFPHQRTACALGWLLPIFNLL